MRRVLQRTGWALAAAGGIGIAAPALGQPPAVRILGPGGHVEESGVVTGVVVALTESQARLAEGQVELAFLADPLLFSYTLATHVEGDTLEVRGYVPTEAAREQALRVARERWPLHVTDKVRILPTVTTHSAVDRPENIRRAARELLEAFFPEHGKAMGIQCDARGHVTVSGTVGSYEDKVLVSRKLRQVPGCSCVINQLNVPAAPPPAAPAETADLVVPDAPPVPAKPAVRKSEPSAPAVPARTVASPAKKVSEPPPLAMPRVYSGPAAAPAPAEVKPLPEPPLPKRWVPPAPPLDIPLPPAKAAEPGPAPPGSVSKDRPAAGTSPGGPPPDLSPIGGAKPAPVKPAEGTLTLTPPPLPPSQPASAPVRLTAPPAKVPAPPPLAPPPLPLPPPTKAPAAPRHDLGGSEESYVTEGTITFDDPQPAKPAAGSGKPLSPAPAKPAAGTITLTPPPPPTRSVSAPVTLTVAPAKVPAPPAPAPPPRPTVPPAVRLKERIQGVCGPAYAVKVTAGPGKSAFNVEVIGPRAGDQERLLGRIAPVLESPEFSALQINCDISAPAK